MIALRAWKFNDPVAMNAARMMVQLFIIHMLKMLVLFAKGRLADNARLAQFMQTAINGCARNSNIFLFANFHDFFRGKMAMCPHDGREHFASAGTQIKARARKVFFKPFLLLVNSILNRSLHNETVYHRDCKKQGISFGNPFIAESRSTPLNRTAHRRLLFFRNAFTRSVIVKRFL